MDANDLRWCEFLSDAIKEFGDEWRRGNTNVRTFFLACCEKTPELRENTCRRELAHALIRADMQNRRRTRQDHTSVLLLDDYYRMLPEMGPVQAVPYRLVAEEYRTRLAVERNVPSKEEYGQRFPRHDAGQLMAAIELAISEAVRANESVPVIKGFSKFEYLDRGSFGIVYKAWEEEAQRWVAIKVLLARSKAVLERQEQEAVLIARISHPNVIRLWHARIKGTYLPYLALELTSDTSLRDKINELRIARPTIGRRWQRESIAMLSLAVDGVAAAHDLKVVHRDLKPENILIGADDTPRVADFGLARLKDDTKGGGYGTTCVGTREYAAPEVIEGKPPTRRSDVYSLGLILREYLFALDGRDTRRASDRSRASQARVNRNLAAIIEKCIHRDPQQRYDTARKLSQDLEHYLIGWPVTARKAKPWEYAIGAVRRWPLPSAIVFLLLFGISAIAAIAGTYQASNLTSQVTVLESDAAELRTDSKIAKQQLANKSDELQREQKTSETRKVELQHATAALEDTTDDKRLNAYAADLQEIQIAWDGGDVGRVRALLDRNVPTNTDLERDLRGFEWYYWKERLKRSGQVLDNEKKCRSLALSPGGALLAAADNERVSLWDLRSGTRIWKRPILGRRFQTNVASIFRADTSVAFSPDGTKLAATGYVGYPKHLGFVRVWETVDGTECFSELGNHQLGGRSVCFDTTGRFLVVGGRKMGWSTWEIETGRKAKGLSRTADEKVADSRQVWLREEDGDVGRICFSKDGKSIFFFAISGGTECWTWEVQKGRENMFRSDTIRSQGILNARHVTDVGRLPDGTLLYGCGVDDGGLLHLYGETVRKNGWESPAPLDKTIHAPSQLTCIDTDGVYILAGALDRRLYKWSYINGVVTQSPPLVGHTSTISCVLLEKRRCISADHSGAIRLWSDGEFRPSIAIDRFVRKRVHEAGKYEIKVVDPEGSVVASCSFAENEEAGPVTESPHGRCVVFAILGKSRQGRQGRIRNVRTFVVDTRSGKHVLELESNERTAKRISFSGDETRIFAAGQSQVAVYSCENGSLLNDIRVNGWQTFAVNNSGTRIAFADDAAIAVVNVDSGDRERIFTAAEPRGFADIHGLRFSRDESTLAIDGPSVAAWRLSDGQPVPATADDYEPAVYEKRDPMHRLYKVVWNQLTIYCPTTFRELLTCELQFSRHGELVRYDPVFGLDGIVRSEAIDRCLRNIIEEWKNERP